MYNNKNIANALPPSNDDRPIERTIAIVEIDCLRELNVIYGRIVTECVLQYFQAHLNTLIKKMVNVTTISNSRFVLDVRTLNTAEFTEEVEDFRAKIAQSKLSLGPHVLKLSATATIAHVEDGIAVSKAVSKLRLLHDKTKSLGKNKSWFHTEQSVNALAVSQISEPIEQKLVELK